ncbi:MAG: alpha/beta hydrolase [Actinobacteria bacterium]|nr:alpha/beta hydrolase [Actinomycetota bacterium]
MKTETIQTPDGCNLVFDVLEGENKGFLLVHGLASNARLWDGLAEQLNVSGHQVAIVDQRGHGRSGKPDTGYDFATITSDLAQIADFLSKKYNFQKPIVVGQSWGAAVVESFAQNYPELTSGIVAVDGGFGALIESFPDWEDCQKVLAPPNMLGMKWTVFEDMVRTAHPDWPESGIRGVLANMEKLPDGTLRPWLKRENHMKILYHLWQHNPFEICAKIDVPILFVPAGGDPLRDQHKRDGLDRLSVIAKKCKTVWFDPASHDLHAQFPTQLAQLLVSELKDGIFS